MQDFLDPKKALKEIKVHEGHKVGDFGCGTGGFTKVLGPIVGTTGRVFAVDVQKSICDRLEKEVKEGVYENTTVIWGDIEKKNGTKINDGFLDFVFFANTLFLVEDKFGAIKEATRTLKKGGRIVVIDWTDSWGGIGPHKDHLFTKTDAKDLFMKFGMNVEKEFDAGAHHYGIILKSQ
ncbi:methyltransferase domain-containing protein [Candidatus Nomurabacteria bacterium]|nr:methyltransferase domain-containing protein [Candidatus Nomurabacteria bacterium]USN95080.1 MAG: methyltransferase domain-containing protein [Candidatus Nomurabacteria bacterium]